MTLFKAELDKLNAENQLRAIHDINKKEGKFIYVNGQRLLNLSSNDYLGMGTDKYLLQEFISKKACDEQFLFSSTSSRLLSGTSEVYNKLEKILIKSFRKESALIYGTGYQCNLGVISGLFNKNDVIFCDKLNHASIIDGIKLSSAVLHRYKHADYEHLEELLKKHRHNHKNAIIISESVFSMDGDIADVAKLVELKEKYNTMLMIDEAHTFGIFGNNLCGISEQENLLDSIDIITATFGKSYASAGAFVVANKILIDYLINKSRSFIFSTALPPANIMWTKWLMERKSDILQSNKNKLKTLTAQTLDYMQKLGIGTISKSQIIPIIVGSNKKAVELSKYLQEKGYFVLPIRPPAVAPNASRIRLSLRADINFSEIKNVLDLVKEFLNNEC